MPAQVHSRTPERTGDMQLSCVADDTAALTRQADMHQRIMTSGRLNRRMPCQLSRMHSSARKRRIAACAATTGQTFFTH